MKIKEVRCKSILVKSNLPGCDFVINPYVGCQHACVYCYARFMKRFTDHPEPWGEFLDIKVNTPEVLEKQLSQMFGSKNNQLKIKLSVRKKPTVFLSSVTDPYLPIERKYKLTRKCLEILLKYQMPVSILTKSDLVLRDLDLLKKFKDVSVGLSITGADDKISKFFEPYASSESRRVKAVSILHKERIRTYGFVGPILPYLTDLPKLFKLLSGKVSEIMLETLNTKPSSWIGVEKVLKKNDPELFPKYKEIFFTKAKKDYLDQLRAEIDGLSKKYKIKTRLFIH